MQNGIKVQVSGVTRSDDWYGDDVNVYVSVPANRGSLLWTAADYVKAESVRIHSANGRTVAKFPNVNAMEAAELMDFLKNNAARWLS